MLNEKHLAQGRMTLGVAYCAWLLSKRVSTIGTEDMLKVLTPVWHDKPETHSRLRGCIERVLEYAKTKGWRTGSVLCLLLCGGNKASQKPDTAAAKQMARDFKKDA